MAGTAKLKHFLLNLSWKCQSQCSYCWVQQTVRQRPELYQAPDRDWTIWAAAIHRDAPEVVDIAGGEPLLVPWLLQLIRACPNTAFGLSSNGLALGALARLLRIHPENVISFNLSYHPETVQWWPDYDEQFKMAMRLILDAGGMPHTNIVDAPGNVDQSQAIVAWLAEQGIQYEISPYERMDILGEKTETGLCCEGGVNHLTVAPDGTAWPCLSALRSPYWKELALGNWLDDTVDITRKPQPCYLQCVDYYVLPEQHSAGDMWQVCARPCEAGA